MEERYTRLVYGIWYTRIDSSLSPCRLSIFQWSTSSISKKKNVSGFNCCLPLRCHLHCGILHRLTAKRHQQLEFGNHNGLFDINGHNFATTAQSIRLEGTRLRAKLFTDSRREGSNLDLAAVPEAVDGKFAFESVSVVYFFFYYFMDKPINFLPLSCLKFEILSFNFNEGTCEVFSRGIVAGCYSRTNVEQTVHDRRQRRGR